MRFPLKDDNDRIPYDVIDTADETEENHGVVDCSVLPRERLSEVGI